MRNGYILDALSLQSNGYGLHETIRPCIVPKNINQDTEIYGKQILRFYTQSVCAHKKALLISLYWWTKTV